MHMATEAEALRLELQPCEGLMDAGMGPRPFSKEGLLQQCQQRQSKIIFKFHFQCADLDVCCHV